MTATLAIADDHEILRDALTRYATELGGYEVVASVGDAQAAVNACRVRTPDLLLLDIEMPGRDALSAIRDVHAVSPGTRVVVLSAYCRDSFIQLALDNDAAGYLVKSDPPSVIFESLEKILRGSTAYSKSVQARMGERTPDTRADNATCLARLTPREIEVLRGIGRGLDNRQMAAAMSLSIRTVERHVSRLMDAVGIRDRAQLMKYAYDQGLVV